MKCRPPCRLKRLVKGIEPLPQHAAIPTLRDFIAELEQLQEEFSDVSIDWKRRRLSVATAAIQLERIELGSFSIRLRWDDWAKDPGVACFQIVALDPHPASVN